MSTHKQYAAASLVGAFGLAITLFGCADRRSVNEVDAHPASFTEESSADFHGNFVLRDGVESCRGCHGTELKGEAEAPSCAGAGCHDGAGGHPYGWVVPSSAHFHGDAVAANGNAACANCHGSNFRGGWSGVSCFDCHAGGPSGHPDGWLEPRSSSFHGQVVLQEGVNDCTRCHGFGLSGGTSGVACADCHR